VHRTTGRTLTQATWTRGAPAWYAARMPARVLLLGVLVAIGVVRVAMADGARQVAASLDNERDQCNFLIMLCREANRAATVARNTPAQTELLADKHRREAEMHAQDAYDAADVIAAKHPPGKPPSCFSSPECSFLKNGRAR
jgi:hypothetical protein